MKPIQREEILDYITYGEKRTEIQKSVLKQKHPRRIHLGEYLTFLFENPETIRYQIQEMMRAEQIVKEEAILHEIKTYNELIGKDGELGCVLLIEIADAKLRPQKLKEWFGLQEKVYLILVSGERIYAKWDRRQMDEGKLSSVQYLKFDTSGKSPNGIGVDHSGLKNEIYLSEEQRNALISDL
jgi:hypothetical protein